MIGYSKIDQCGPPKVSQTKKNISANQQLDKIYQEKGIKHCELSLAKNCLHTETWSNGEKLRLSYAHRHKRLWYRQHPELLGSFEETLRACIHCHQLIEHDRALSELFFSRLRGKFSIKGLTNTER